MGPVAVRRPSVTCPNGTSPTFMQVRTRRNYSSGTRLGQHALALVEARTAARSPAPPWIASVMVDLQTPLQPQISASGGKAATARGHAPLFPGQRDPIGPTFDRSQLEIHASGNADAHPGREYERFFTGRCAL